MAQQLKPEHEWLGHVQPTGLVVSTLVLDELSLVPQPQDAVDTAQFAEVLDETGGPLLPDTWALLREVLKWPEAMVAGLPGTDPIPVELCHSLADHETLLQPTYALKGPRGEGWQLLVRVEDHDIEPDKPGRATSAHHFPIVRATHPSTAKSAIRESALKRARTTSAKRVSRWFAKLLILQTWHGNVGGKSHPEIRLPCCF